MSQHDMDVANQGFAALRADLNNALLALASQSSGATAPATTVAYQIWADTTANLLKRRNAANSGWIVLGTLSETFVLSRSSNTILAGSDIGKTIVATAAFTQTLTAAATLGDGWFCSYNAGGFSIVLDPNGSEQIDGATTKTVTGSGFIYCNGSAFFTIGFPASSVTAVCAAVRQAISGGPTDSAGLPNLSGSTGSTTVTTSNISSSAPFCVAAAYGFDNATGKALDYFGFSTSNLSWTGLSTNGTMYLFVDVNTSTGALTTGSTTLAPTYQWGGTYSTTNLQNTYNIQDGMMKVGNGSTASQVARVFVGEVTVAGGVVTAITWYAYNRRYVGAEFGLAASTVYTQNHNLGGNPNYMRTRLQAICKTANLNWAVGDRVDVTSSGFNNSGSTGVVTALNSTASGANSVSAAIITGGTLSLLDKSSATSSGITVGSWKLQLTVEGDW